MDSEQKLNRYISEFIQREGREWTYLFGLDHKSAIREMNSYLQTKLENLKILEKLFDKLIKKNDS